MEMKKYIDVWCDDVEVFRSVIAELEGFYNAPSYEGVILRFNTKINNDSNLLIITNDKTSDDDVYKIQITTNKESISNNVSAYVLCDTEKERDEAALCILSTGLIPGLACVDFEDIRTVFNYGHFRYLSFKTNEEPRCMNLAKMIKKRIRGLGENTMLGFAPHNNMSLSEISEVLSSIRDCFDLDGDKNILFVTYQDEVLSDNYMRVSLFVYEKMVW